VGEDFEAGADRAAFGVVGAVGEARDTSLDDGARTHAAGLDGDVEGCIGEPVVAEQAGSIAKDNNFGVGGGVVVANGAVAGSGEDLAVMDEHGADGDFAGCGRAARFRERCLHELVTGLHVGPENSMRKEEKRN